METDKQIADIATTLEAIKKSLESHTTSFAKLTTWKTGVEARVHSVDTKISEVDIKVGGLNASIDELHHQIGRIELQHQANNPAYKVFDVEHIDLTNSGATPLAQPPNGASSGPHGHSVELQNRRSGCGVVTTLLPPPVKAVSEEERDVRAPTSDENSNQAANRPRRLKRPSTKVFGPEWRN
ncbi:uncharacterized protein LOC120691071 isoform X1 [Panicum virgatum]|uniref:uncharacterized protein LOC120691071 isoform X1 n=1 Tax=Panicum virgatum TaxID=38727 RepID=UPI0019D64681|nr:uncharacterized protein LOC120691071 isoform X1 [Panicum virgatum]